MRSHSRANSGELRRALQFAPNDLQYISDIGQQFIATKRLRESIKLLDCVLYI